jgi:hypothetical protein
MTIKTKYAVGDEVWFNYEGRIKRGTIKYILVKVGDLSSIKYEIQIGGYLLTYNENALYPTQEKLIKKEKKYLKSM